MLETISPTFTLVKDGVSHFNHGSDGAELMTEAISATS
jgi:hypothetical protein